MKAIGFLQTKEMGLGYIVADAMVKAAPVTIIESKPMCPGWFFILVAGEAAAVRSAVNTGQGVAGSGLLAKGEIYKVSKSVLKAMNNRQKPEQIKSLGFIETRNLVTGIQLSDVAVKSGKIEMIRLSRVVGNCGKTLSIFTGETAAVNQALNAARSHESFEKNGVSAYAIASPSKAIIEQL
jgi:microcompartment protein CcmL/EutN